MLRYTFAVEMLLAGVPIDQVSMLLGYASVKITEKHYSPSVKARQDQLAASVRNAWGPLGTVPPRPTTRQGEAGAAASLELGGLTTVMDSDQNTLRDAEILIAALPGGFVSAPAQNTASPSKRRLTVFSLTCHMAATCGTE
jgi:hypothetical protein